MRHRMQPFVPVVFVIDFCLFDWLFVFGLFFLFKKK